MKRAVLSQMAATGRLQGDLKVFLRCYSLCLASEFLMLNSTCRIKLLALVPRLRMNLPYRFPTALASRRVGDSTGVEKNNIPSLP